MPDVDVTQVNQVHQVGGRRVMAAPAAISRSDHFVLRPYGPTIGAEIAGIDLDRPLADPVVRDLKRAFLDWKVLFFRDQALSPAGQVRLARYWGEPVSYPLPAKGELPEIVRVAHGPDAPGSENTWHSDVTFQRTPALGSILKAVELPPSGGDTLWADMAAAYDGLTEVMKARIEGLFAVHDFLARYEGAAGSTRAKRSREMFPVAEHPLVYSHPETGRRILYVNRVYTTRILGLPEAEGGALLGLLCDQAHHPEYQVRFRWTPGAVALWDNRATQHYAVSDYYPHRRLMERVTIAGTPAAAG
jgi:taurine dioxygenase